MIGEPTKGSAMRAGWAGEVTRGVNRCMDFIDRIQQGTVKNRRIVQPYHPFEVVGATSQDGEATFCIFLPDASLVVDGTTVSPSGVTAVQDSEGLYTVDNLDSVPSSAGSAIPLYLLVYEDNNGVGATIGTSGDLQTGQTSILTAVVAKIWSSTAGEKSFGAVACQLVRSALIVGSGTTGGASGGSTSGFSGSRDVPYAYDGPRSDGILYAKTKKWTYQNGLLKSISTQDSNDIVVADTVAHSGL